MPTKKREDPKLMSRLLFLTFPKSVGSWEVQWGMRATSPDSTLFSLALLFLFPGVTACPFRPGSWCPDLTRLILRSIFKFLIYTFFPFQGVENRESLSKQLIPASNFFLLAPWSLSHPGFPIFWTFIHCHSFELSFPFTVRSKLLSLRSSNFVPYTLFARLHLDQPWRERCSRWKSQTQPQATLLLPPPSLLCTHVIW